MKIALISPPLLLTPPRGYGGLEQIVYDLGCALVEQGHDVTLFAPPGSYMDGATLVETIVAPERTDVDWIDLERQSFDIYKSKIQGFDIIHDHTWFAFPYLEKFDPNNKDMRLCHTSHGHIDWDPKKVPEPIKPVNLIAISQYMQSEYKAQGWESRYVYNGINLDKYPFYDGKREDYLVTVGRITRMKGVHAALKIAQETNIPINIVGGSFIDANEKEFLEAIETECDNSHGLATLHLDLAHDKKLEFLQHARACLVLSSFKEPYGLTATESLSTGCPVICYNDGALKEIINNPRIGTVCNDYDAALKAVQSIDTAKYDPKACRERAEYFSREKMAERYLKVYEDVIAGKGW